MTAWGGGIARPFGYGGGGHEHGTGGPAQHAGRPDNRVAGSRLWSRPRCSFEVPGDFATPSLSRSARAFTSRGSTEVACVLSYFLFDY